jgi:hypothetical protein
MSEQIIEIDEDGKVHFPPGEDRDLIADMLAILKDIQGYYHGDENDRKIAQVIAKAEGRTDGV